MGVTKNIIPAVASTNAIVSAACVNEAIKILTGCGPTVDSYMQYLGQSRTQCNDFRMEKKEDCFVCTRSIVKETVRKGLKVQDWLDGEKDEEGKPLKDEENNVIKGFKARLMLKNPTLVSKINTNYLTGTGVYASKCKANYEMTFGQLLDNKVITQSGEEWEMTDPQFNGMKILCLTIEENADTEMKE